MRKFELDKSLPAFFYILINQFFIINLFITFFTHLKMSKDSLAKCYRDNKDYKKKNYEKYQRLSEEKRKNATIWV